MDFSVKRWSKFRRLEGPPLSLQALAGKAPQAEAYAVQFVQKTRPLWEWLHATRRRLATGLVALLAIWLFFHVTFGANGWVIYKQKHIEYEQIKKQTEALQRENDTYTQRIQSLKNDPRTIEKEAREQLHYARPGEVVYVAPAPPSATPPSTDSARK